jgi:hypothetical protein
MPPSTTTGSGISQLASRSAAHRGLHVHLLHHHAVEDERQRRREEQAEAPRRGDQAEAEALGVPGAQQRRVEERTDRHDRDPRRPGEGGEERAGRQRDDGEPTAQPAQERARQPDEAVRRPALPEDVAREGEQRDRHQGGHLRQAIDLDGHHREIDALALEAQQRTRGDHGKEGRSQQREDQQQDAGDDHVASVRGARRARASARASSR